jgi:hypothetical protein
MQLILFFLFFSPPPPPYYYSSTIIHNSILLQYIQEGTSSRYRHPYLLLDTAWLNTEMILRCDNFGCVSSNDPSFTAERANIVDENS